jgi:hypothetical protein
MNAPSKILRNPEDGCCTLFIEVDDPKLGKWWKEVLTISDPGETVGDAKLTFSAFLEGLVRSASYEIHST